MNSLIAAIPVAADPAPGVTPQSPMSFLGNLAYTFYNDGQPATYACCAVAMIIGGLMCLYPPIRKLGKGTVLAGAIVALFCGGIAGFIFFFKSSDASSQQNVFTILPPIIKFHLSNLLL